MTYSYREEVYKKEVGMVETIVFTVDQATGRRTVYGTVDWDMWNDSQSYVAYDLESMVSSHATEEEAIHKLVFPQRHAVLEIYDNLLTLSHADIVDRFNAFCESHETIERYTVQHAHYVALHEAMQAVMMQATDTIPFNLYDILRRMQS